MEHFQYDIQTRPSPKGAELLITINKATIVIPVSAWEAKSISNELALHAETILGTEQRKKIMQRLDKRIDRRHLYIKKRRVMP